MVVNKNGQHWIEWIKIVCIESQNIHIGISCKYASNKWSVQSICLDKGDIFNKHRLVGCNEAKYLNQLLPFKTSITEIIFSDNASNDGIKQQVRCQQQAIVKLKAQLAKAKAEKLQIDCRMSYVIAYIYLYLLYNPKTCCIPSPIQNNNDDEKSPSFEDVEDFDDEMINEEGMNDIDKIEVSNDEIMVMPHYFDRAFSDSLRNRVGAQNFIFIDKSLTKSCLNTVFPKFRHESSIYYWFDHTIAIQMIQKAAKMYISIATRKLIIVIVNLDLNDCANNDLYGVIIPNPARRNAGKYQYKLKKVMTAIQIKSEYDIEFDNLPKPSRQTKHFLNKLLMKPNICPSDLKNVCWKSVKISRAPTKNIHIPKSEILSISPKEFEYDCCNALNRNELIPILVINKSKCCYDIEWVLIVHIPRNNMNVGASFRFDAQRNKFNANKIYLDKKDIASMHALIGLKRNYCAHLHRFRCKKFTFVETPITSPIATREYDQQQQQRQQMLRQSRSSSPITPNGPYYSLQPEYHNNMYSTACYGYNGRKFAQTSPTVQYDQHQQKQQQPMLPQSRSSSPTTPNEQFYSSRPVMYASDDQYPENYNNMNACYGYN